MRETVLKQCQLPYSHYFVRESLTTRLSGIVAARLEGFLDERRVTEDCEGNSSKITSVTI